MNATVTPIAKADARDIRAEVGDLIAQNKKLTRNTIAREAGISPSAFSSWMAGNYAGNEDNVEAKVAMWVDNHRARQQQAKQLPAAPEFVLTPTAKRINGALSYAQLAADIVVIYGGAGTSKSETCRDYAGRNPNVWIATFTPATKTTVPALEEIAHAVGVGTMTGTGAGKLQRAIIARMERTNGLLIIDEAHNLNQEALDTVRALHDLAKIGLALVGNEQVYSRMTGDNRAAYLDRLYSRIGKRLHVIKPTKTDIDMIVDAWKFKDDKCAQTCREIASKPGGLRQLTKTLRLATLYAAGDNRELCCDDIVAAYRELGADS